MLKRIVSLLPILYLSNLHAQESLELGKFYTDANVSGELRALYQYNSDYEYLDAKRGASHTGALGAKVSLSSGKVYDVDVVLTGYGVVGGLEDRNRVDMDYLNNGRENADYALLGESFIRYTKENSYIQVGRFSLDTPLLNPDDVRMTPDLYEGLHAYLKFTDSWALDLGYIDAMAGWENLSDNAKFENIGDAIDISGTFSGGYHVGKSSISFMGAVFEDEHLPYSFRIYDYLTQKVMNQVYLEASMKKDIYEVGAQYLRSMADSRLKEFGGSDLIESTVYGLRGSVGIHNLKVSLAYNESLKKKNTLFEGGAPDFFGGANDPLFTSMDVLVADQLGGVKAYKGEILYAPTEHISLDVSHALFHKGDGYDQSETDFGVNGSFYEYVELAVKLSNLSTDMVGSKVVNNRARAVVKIRF